MRIGLAVAALLVVSACGGSDTAIEAPSPATKAPPKVVPAIALVELPYPWSVSVAEGECDATGKYSAIKPGVQVVVSDADGTAVAAAPLKLNTASDKSCLWSANLPDIPAGGKFYRATVGEWSTDLVPEGDVGAFALTPAKGDSALDLNP